MNQRRLSVLPGLLILAVMIIVGLCTYQDYGIAWDEPIQREMGLVSGRYIFKGDKFLETYIERDHGTGFELPLVMLEKALRIKDSRDIYLMRHLVTHLFFLCSMFCGYLLLLRLTANQLLSCLGFLILLMHPRLYGHSFFNSKDVPFLCALIIAFMFAESALSTDRRRFFLMTGIALGYATSIRILGILPLCVLSGLLLTRLLLKPSRSVNGLTNLAIRMFSLWTGFAAFTILFWPTLWKNPVGAFLESYHSMSSFRWAGQVKYKGVMVSGTDIPWDYLPTWFSITTPVVFLALGAFGLISLIYWLLRRPLRFLKDPLFQTYLLYGCCTILPVLMVIVLKSVVYDDWRHLYFIYPSFVLLGIGAVSRTKKDKRVAGAIAGALIIQIGFTGVAMLKLHPFHQVYFNRLVSHKPNHLLEQYDREYWGTGVKQGMEYILEHDKRDEIRVTGIQLPIPQNRMILNANDRQRINAFESAENSDYGNADYYITYFRESSFPYHLKNVVYEESRQGSPVLRVYKLK